MENGNIPQKDEKVIDSQQPQLIKFIDIDLRDIDAFGFLQQVFLENFSRSQSAKEYMPFWLFARSQKFLEKRYKKKLKEILKLYKKTLINEKHQRRKDKYIERKRKRKDKFFARKQKFCGFFKKIFNKIARIFKKTKKE